jgi:hypothetical protein
MKVALIGATGNVGSSIEHGSAGCRKDGDGWGVQARFHVRQIFFEDRHLMNFALISEEGGHRN